MAPFTIADTAKYFPLFFPFDDNRKFMFGFCV